MSRTDRRRFLMSSATGIAAAATVASVRTAHAAPSDKVRLGLIGCGGRGSGLGRTFAGLANVEVAYVCDVDTRAVAKAVASTKKPSGTV
ncbi:MAG: hypothetical protein IH991_11795 [Planctomycetes bacterium]|nr:hypothetical protein [Planctomycetota bacterium]